MHGAGLNVGPRNPVQVSREIKKASDEVRRDYEATSLCHPVLQKGLNLGKAAENKEGSDGLGESYITLLWQVRVGGGI